MAPPPVPLRYYADASVIARQVTEDRPPDLLQGSMKLKVTLPSGKQTNINVHRSTPMMDVLVQVTSAHKINPGNHAIRVVCNNKNISYKPSTAVGSLDISAIEIVSKTSKEEGNNKDDKQSKDKKVRLKEWVYKQKLVVNLPRNQLAVYRLPPKTLISEVFSIVCEDKNFEEEDFEMRHPVNLDERLRGSCSLSDYQLQEVCIVSKNYRAPPLSVNDLFAMSSLSHHHEDRKRRGFRAFFSRKNKHTFGNSSLSSGSTGDRSESPENEATKIQSSSRLSLHVPDGLKYRPGNQKMFRPTSLINLTKVHRKRPAPIPPQGSSMNGVFTNGSSVTTSCQNLSVDGSHRTMTPLSSELKEGQIPSRSSSRNTNSPIGGPTVPSRMKRKAPLPPTATIYNKEIISSQDKNSSVSPSPEPVCAGNETRSTTPSEVSIDVRPSSSEVSDAIIEEDDIQNDPAENVRSRNHSPAFNNEVTVEDVHQSDTIQEQNNDACISKPVSVTDEEPRDNISPSFDNENRESLKETSLESASIDEEISSPKSIETLDEILEKAEADLNERNISSPSNLSPTRELTDLPLSDAVSCLLANEETNKSSLNEDRDESQLNEDRDESPLNEDRDESSLNEDRDESLLNEDVNMFLEEGIHELETVQEETVAEALNEMWNGKDSPNMMEDIRKNVFKFKDNEVEKNTHENSENQILIFNFLERNPNRVLKSNIVDGTFKEKSTEKYITQLNHSISALDECKTTLDAIATSNYNVILKMKPQPRPRTEMGRKSPSSDSTSSYYSFKTESETKSRSNTDASYESVPPPLPSEPIPELSEFDDNRSVYSIVSSSSSIDTSRSQCEDSVDSITRDGDAKPKMFSISTYTNRDQRRSYTKRLTRSESLQEISRPLEVEKIEIRTSSLQRNQSVKSESLKANEWAHHSSEGSNSLERNNRFRTGTKEVLEKISKITEEHASPTKVVAEESTKISIKPATPLRVSKWYQEFNKEYIGSRNPSNLRKTKSIADIRMNDGQPPPGPPDPALAQEYLKLQNDFMKWQNQLMQNQNLLHNKVAPIAAPNMAMGQNPQASYNAEPEPARRREINIPIRMEGENETFMNQTSTFTSTNSMTGGPCNNEMFDSSLNQPQMWNAPTNVTMGSWNDRPSDVECVIVNDPPQVFQAPTDPRFMPVFIKRELNPSAFGPSFIPAEPVFTGPQFEPPTSMNNQFSSFPSRSQFADGNSQYATQPRSNESSTTNNTFQAPPSREADVNNQNKGHFMPSLSNSQKMPTYNSSRPARDDSNGKFTSVVTLSNDQDSNSSPKNVSAPVNNFGVAPTRVAGDASSFTPKEPAWRVNSKSGANNRSNNWNKSASPEKGTLNMTNDSFTPMSSRLVQAASTQPTAFDSRSNTSSNFDTAPTSHYTPFKPPTVSQYPSTCGDNSVMQPPSVADSRLTSQPATNFVPMQSPKPQIFDPRPAPKTQTFPPMPKFEPPPSFEPQQEPMRISPPRRQKKSPSPVKHDIVPRSSHSLDSRTSPIRDQLTDSFASMKPPSVAPTVEHFPPQPSVIPPPPAPPCDVPPPPPPPPPRMNPEIRRTSTGKKIFSSNNQAPELDAREELMMAIRNFGGSEKLRKRDDY